LNALDIELQTKNTEFQNGNNTLRFFIKAGQKIGLFKDKKITDLIQEYQFVPYATNVYTFYSPYIRDMGLIYAFFILSMIAIVHTWLYKIAQTVPKARLYYSFLLFPLLLTFFADQYLSLFSFWLQIFLLTELIYFINKLFKHD
jgi:oligosaccharide repeat unit polymerase